MIVTNAIKSNQGPAEQGRKENVQTMKREKTRIKNNLSFVLGVRRSWQLYLLLLPAMVYLLIFHYVPLYGIQIAFRDYSPGLGFSESPFVGLKHFIYFMKSPQFATLIKNTISLNVLRLVFCFPFPIFLALVLNEASNARFQKLVQNLTYAPHFISTVVLCGMIVSFTSPSTGIINTFIQALGRKPIDFMGQESWFRPIYILSDMWKDTGWSSIIYLAALAGIDLSLHEAAQIDGASRLQRILYINIPGISATIIILLIMEFGRMMSLGFEKVYLLQNSLNLPVSEVISTYVYKTGLLGAKFSYTTAIDVFNSIINCGLLLIVNKISSRVGETSLF